MSNAKFFAYINETLGEYGIEGNRYKVSPSQMADCNFLTAIYRERGFNYPKFHKMDELSKAGFLVSEMAIGSLTFPLDKKTTGVVFFNRESSLPTDINFEATIKDADNFFPSPSVFVYTLPNILSGEVCIRNGVQGESSFYVLENLDINSIGNVCVDMLATNSAVVCGWLEIVDGKIGAIATVFTRDDLKKD